MFDVSLLKLLIYKALSILFQLQQFFFDIKTIGEASHFAIGLDYPVAGDYYEKWIFAYGSSYSSYGFGLIDFLGDFFVGSGFPIGDFY